MLQLVLSAALCGLAVPPPAAPQEATSVLAIAPADALFVAYSPDVRAVRDAVVERPGFHFFVWFSGTSRPWCLVLSLPGN